MQVNTYHRPGVPHGHSDSPPKSRQAGVVKSLLNQNVMAVEMVARSVGSPVQFAAFLKPPCQADAKVSEVEVSDKQMSAQAMAYLCEPNALVLANCWDSRRSQRCNQRLPRWRWGVKMPAWGTEVIYGGEGGLGRRITRGRCLRHQ